MKNWVFLFVIFVMGCGKKYGQFQVDSDLQPYVDQFLASAEMRGQKITLKNLIIKLGNANDIKPQVNKIGYCLYKESVGGSLLLEDTDETNIIVIDRTFFEKASTTDYNRRELIFHELGHCVLDRMHDERMTNGYPESIMYPSSVSMRNWLFYQQNESRYFDELFKVVDSAIVNGSPSQSLDKIEESGKETLFITTEDGCVKDE